VPTDRGCAPGRRTTVGPVPLHPVDGLTLVRVATSHGRVDVVAEPRHDVAVEGGRARREGSTLTVEGGAGRVEVRVPEGTAVVVGTSSGRVRLAGRLGAVSAATTSGRITVDDVASADLRAVSGRIEVTRCAGTCRARTASGRIDIGEVGGLDASTDAGRIRVRHVSGEVQARTTSGRIDIGIEGPSEVSAETISGRIVLGLGDGLGARLDASSAGHVDNRAPAGDDCRIVARSASGRVEVRS
jgi:DUF4097 and DUF4098 domain-containing protein YvlB